MSTAKSEKGNVDSSRAVWRIQSKESEGLRK